MSSGASTWDIIVFIQSNKNNDKGSDAPWENCDLLKDADYED